MDYLIVFLGGRWPEHHITDTERDDEFANRYICWVQEGICRVFRSEFTDDEDITHYELQRNGQWLLIEKVLD